jgi:hypothetical protein
VSLEKTLFFILLGKTRRKNNLGLIAKAYLSWKINNKKKMGKLGIEIFSTRK